MNWHLTESRTQAFVRTGRMAVFLLLLVSQFGPIGAAAQTTSFSPQQTALIARVEADINTLKGWYDWYYASGKAGGYRHPEFSPEIVEYRGKYASAYFHSSNILNIKPKTIEVLNADGGDNNFDHFYSGGSPVKVKRKDTIEFYRQRCNATKNLIEKARGYMSELLTTLKKAPFTVEVLNELDVQVRDSLMLNASNAVGTGNLDSCMLYYANVYYVYHYASAASGPDNAFLCVANFIIDKSKTPDPNGDGTCVEHKVSPWNWGRPPGCTHNCAINDQSIPMENAGGYPLWFPRYFMYEAANRPSPSNPTGGIDYYLDAYTRINNQLDFNKKLLTDATSKVVAAADVAEKKAADDAAAKLATLKAETLSKGSVLTLPLPLSDITVEGVIGRVIAAIMGIVGAIALLMFIWGGLSWMLAAGNAEKIAKAKKTIGWAALGIIAIFSSYAVLSLIIQTFSAK